MAETTKISWTRSTWNPWIGCTKVSPGCDHCYASVSTPARTMGIEWGPGKPRRRTSAANWRQPLRWNAQAAKTGERWLVFCSSLADVFDNEVPLDWRLDLFALIQCTPHLMWLLLTKRIGNVKGMVSDLWWRLNPHVSLGATIVNQAEADRDIPKLRAVPAARRFISYEPALGPIEFSNVTKHADGVQQLGKPALDGIHWLIIGGESNQPGMRARPFDVEWARDTVRQCKAAGVPVFFKQGGSHAILDGKRIELRNRSGTDLSEFPVDIQVREFPHA